MDLRSDDIVGGLKEKIKTIVSLFEVEKSRNDVLKEKNLELTARVTELENRLDDLDKKYENIKIAKVLSSVPGEDVHETKLQVNRIVREIDKCIALLNR
jgi:FtsZ-binding cell division protein ZapB